VIDAAASAIGEVAYQPHGSLLAAASGDGVALIDLASGERIPVIAFPTPSLNSTGSLLQAAQNATGFVQFDASGQRLLTFGYSTMLLWSLLPSDWVVAACRAAGRNLTRAEWTELVGSSVPYHATCTQWSSG
jgi:hypothetical protein